MNEFERTDRNKVRRKPERACYDSETIYAIVDAAPICHVAFEVDGQPFTIPTLHARLGDTLLLHGSPGHRLIRHVQAGNEVSASFVLVDGLVVAKAVFHHSLNFRSAVIFGRGRKIEGEEELLKVLEAFTEKILPGRWRRARIPDSAELRITGIAAIEIQSASAKLRKGPPIDDGADADLKVWSGVIPLRPAASRPDSSSQEDIPASVQNYIQKLNEK